MAAAVTLPWSELCALFLLFPSLSLHVKVTNILENESTIFAGVDTLRKICNHPDLAVSVCEPPDYSDPSVPLPWQRSGKMIVLQQLLALWFKRGHRVLVFCQTRQMLNLLEAFVRAEVSECDWPEQKRLIVDHGGDG